MIEPWNLIRLIDTPGIGSAEAAGRNDEDIAESVLGESDIICFVVVDDSIQKDIFEFLERIAERNKPIIILLNHKENIIPEVKFQQFLDHPDQWLTTKGESRLQGHIDRIQKYADSKGFGRLLRIYPVFLLAALLANKEKYVEHQDLLWQHSNVDAFINQLKSWIYTGGSIKRSQTILDEAVMSFSQALESLEKAENLLTDQIQKIESQKSKRIAELRQTESQVLQNLRNDLRRIYTDLGGRQALAFAEEEADKKKPPIEEDWKEFVDSIQFQKQISDAIENNISQYKNKAEALTDELFEDINFGIQNSFGQANIKLPSNFSFRTVGRIVGGLVGIAGSIVLLFSPVGWAISIAGILIEVISGFFKSKEKKRQERVDTVYESIHKTVNESLDDNIETIMHEVEKSILASTGKIEQLLCDLSDGLKRIESMSKDLKQSYRRKNDTLNRVYAWRIIQYITRNLEPYSPKAVSESILHVDRSNPNEIIIRTPISVDQKNISFDGILAETIRVIKE